MAARQQHRILPNIGTRRISAYSIHLRRSRHRRKVAYLNNHGPAPLRDRSFVCLNLTLFLVFANISFLYLYPLILNAMGSALDVIGLVMGVFSCAAVLSRPIMGKLIVRNGESRIFSIGIIASLAASICYSLVTSFGPFMLLVRVVHGLGFSACVSAGFSLAARKIRPGRRTEAFSMIGVSLVCAVAFAPPLGEYLIRAWGFPSLYAAASTAAFLAGVVALKAFQPVDPSSRQKENASVRYCRLLKDRAFVFLLISTFVFSHCQATVPNFIALISSEKGVLSGRFFVVSNVIAIFVLLFIGKRIDRLGKLFFMKLAYPLFSLGILLIPDMISGTCYPVPPLLYGIGIAVLFPTYNALAAGYGSQAEKPAVMALFTATYDSGFVTGAMVSGWIAHATSLNMLFRLSGICAFAGFLTVVFLPIQGPGSGNPDP